jgi:hypothetical protein
MNGKHHLLVYADGISILRKNVNTTKMNTAALLKASGEVGLEVNMEKNAMSYQNAGQVMIY